MAGTRAVRVLVVVLLVTATGCAGLASDGASPEASNTSVGPSDGTTVSGERAGVGSAVVPVSGGSLAYNATVVWDRVQSRLETEYGPPEVVIRSNPVGMYYADGAVYVDPRYAAARSQEQLLAHEFAHYVQDRENDALDVPTVTSPDQGFAFDAGKEGFARQVERWYIDEHAVGVPDDVPLPDGSPEQRWYWARYRFGHDYVSARLAGANGTLALADGPWPNTSEQVIHPERADEPPKPLVVSTPNASERAYVPRSERRLGEMAVRIAVWSRTNATAARQAGRGWGNDRFLAFEGPQGAGAAWVVRYDDASAAAAGQRLFRAYGAADPRPFDPASDHVASEAPPERFVDAFWRGGTDRSFRVERVGAETVVVFVGPRAFVSNVTARGTSGDVVLRTNATATAAQGLDDSKASVSRSQPTSTSPSATKPATSWTTVAFIASPASEQ